MSLLDDVLRLQKEMFDNYANKSTNAPAIVTRAQVKLLTEDELVLLDKHLRDVGFDGYVVI